MKRKSAFESQPNKAVDKRQGKAHKANAKHHGHAAKDAAKGAGK